MIIVCSNCSTRLQLDETKTAGRPFTVRCPKCNNSVNSSAASPASEQGALNIGGSPSTERHRYQKPTAAPTYQLAAAAMDEGSNKETEDALRALLALLSKTQGSLGEGSSSHGWNRRKALVCVTERLREPIAKCLTEDGYQVHVAEDTRQAIETMRANQLQVVLLDPEFDPFEQGAAFVVREINVLRPTQRRRLFFVLLSPSLRTMDAHSAFLNNVNAIVNLADLEDLPHILEVGLREFNELYRELNAAFELPAL